MANTDENFLLVEMTGAATATEKPQIARVIRSYLSNSRATEDLALMRDMLPDLYFQVVPVEHVDS